MTARDKAGQVSSTFRQMHGAKMKDIMSICVGLYIVRGAMSRGEMRRETQENLFHF